MLGQNASFAELHKFGELTDEHIERLIEIADGIDRVNNPRFGCVDNVADLIKVCEDRQGEIDDLNRMVDIITEERDELQEQLDALRAKIEDLTEEDVK